MIIPKGYDKNLRIILEKCALFGFSPVEYFRDLPKESSKLIKIIGKNFSIRNIYDIGSKGGEFALNLPESQNYFYFETRNSFRLFSENIFQSFCLAKIHKINRLNDIKNQVSKNDLIIIRDEYIMLKKTFNLKYYINKCNIILLENIKFEYPYSAYDEAGNFLQSTAYHNWKLKNLSHLHMGLKKTDFTDKYKLIFIN